MLGIGTITAIDHKTVNIKFFGYSHNLEPHLAIEFAEEILSEAKKAQESGPRCRCGHLVEDHGWFNGDSHPDEKKETGCCGCVFSKEAAQGHLITGDNIPLYLKHKHLKAAGWFVGGEAYYRNPDTGRLFCDINAAWDIFVGLYQTEGINDASNDSS